MENINETWKDKDFLSQNLTVEDMENLLTYITPWLRSMELKFEWDYSVNEMTLSQFVEIVMREMYKIVNEDYKVEYELYPKQRDFNVLWNIISESDISNHVDKKDKIWKLIRYEILRIVKEALS